jgi:hypothetical protein
MQDPNDLETIEWAINHLSWFIDSETELLVEWRARLERLKRKNGGI